MAVYYMLCKPRGLITAKRDAEKPTVMECFPEETREKLHPVGRLDCDTEGLLLFTDDGKLDQQLNHPDRHVSKTYFLYAFGEMTSEKLAKLEYGVEMSPRRGISLPAKARLDWVGVLSQVADFVNPLCRDRYLPHPNNPVFGMYLTIHEGKKHQVKLMLRAVGCHVFYLKRVRIGSLALDPELKPGEYREISPDEKELLFVTFES